MGNRGKFATRCRGDGLRGPPSRGARCASLAVDAQGVALECCDARPTVVARLIRNLISERGGEVAASQVSDGLAGERGV